MVLFVDTFSRWFDPENARAAVRVLEAGGYRVHIATTALQDRPLCCGRTFLSAGLVDEARAEARRTLEALGPDASRNAHFVCALALVWPDGHAEWFEGRVDGTLVWPPRGDRGFGYDPMFVPAGREQTFGEMDPAEKHRISHRADAFAKLVDALL